MGNHECNTEQLVWTFTPEKVRQLSSPVLTSDTVTGGLFQHRLVGLDWLRYILNNIHGIPWHNRHYIPQYTRELVNRLAGGLS